MVPSASIRASRFCTVPRATLRFLANVATGTRASARSNDSNFRSVESMDNLPWVCTATANLRKTPIGYDYLYNINRLLINFLASHWSYPSLRLVICFGGKSWLTTLEQSAFARSYHELVLAVSLRSWL